MPHCVPTRSMLYLVEGMRERAGGIVRSRVSWQSLPRSPVAAMSGAVAASSHSGSTSKFRTTSSLLHTTTRNALLHYALLKSIFVVAGLGGRPVSTAQACRQAVDTRRSTASPNTGTVHPGSSNTSARSDRPSLFGETTIGKKHVPQNPSLSLSRTNDASARIIDNIVDRRIGKRLRSRGVVLACRNNFSELCP